MNYIPRPLVQPPPSSKDFGHKLAKLIATMRKTHIRLTMNTIEEAKQRLDEKEIRIAGLTNDLMNIRDALNAKIAEKDAEIFALRGCLEHLRAKDWLADSGIPDEDDVVCLINAGKVRAALSNPPPPVVPLEDVRPLVEAAQRVRHWHDALFNPKTGKDEGMVVSAESVHSLWKAIENLTTKHKLP